MTNAFTPERIAATREILAKHNPEAVSCAMPNFPDALDEIERLQEVNDELERNAEIVSADFEKDCWRAMRKLLEMTGYDFTFADEGVTADEAFEHLAEDFKQSKRDFDQIKAELSRVTAEHDSLIDQVKATTGVSTVLMAARADVSRVTAERDEALGLLSGLIVGKDELALDRLCKAQARSFLSRMEGRKDG